MTDPIRDLAWPLSPAPASAVRSKEKHDNCLRILAPAEMGHGSCAFACVDALRRAGHSVTIVSPDGFIPVGWQSLPLRVLRRIITPVLQRNYDETLLRAVREFRPDLFFVFKGTSVSRQVVEAARELGAIAVNYYPDVSFTAHGPLIPRALPAYDWVFTTKSYGLADMERELGIVNSSFLPHGFDSQTHCPVTLDSDDMSRYGCDASFIGTWSPKKERLLAAVVARLPGIDLKIWGAQWDRAPPQLRYAVIGRTVTGKEYAKAIQASRINIAILSENRAEATSGDQSTTRTFEIPACGGFMLHERTAEADSLFKEGRECAMFGDEGELAAKVKYFMARSEERSDIAAVGLERAHRSGYSYDERMIVILDKVRALSASCPAC